MDTSLATPVAAALVGVLGTMLTNSLTRRAQRKADSNKAWVATWRDLLWPLQDAAKELTRQLNDAYK